MTNNKPETELASESEVKRVKELIASIKNPSLPPPESIDQASYPANLYLEIKSELTDLINFYLNEKPSHASANTSIEEILEDFNKIINSNNNLSKHAEIHIPTILSDDDLNKVRDLFILLEKEVILGSEIVRISKMPMSRDKVIDGKELTKAFDELTDKVIEQEIQEQAIPQVLVDEIPSPTNLRVLFAFFIDLSLILMGSTYIFARYLDLELSVDLLRLNMQQQPILFSSIFLALWFVVQALCLIFTQATLGQSFLNIVVATDENCNPTIRSLVSRLSMHLLNLCTLGLYSFVVVRILLCRGKSIFFCPISKTKLTFKGFTK